MESHIIAVDFDGTCVTHEYPDIGRPILAEDVLRDLTNNGHKIILFTMRSGPHLAAAVDWFAQRNIPLYGINENPKQFTWTESVKPYAHIYIDDAALGVPLIHPHGKRPYVDWVKVEGMLHDKGLI